MKNKNPYLSLLVLFGIALVCSCTSCIVGMLNLNFWQVLLNYVLSIVDAIYVGWFLCKFVEHRQLVKHTNALKQALKDFEELVKAKENEPFKEFENNGESSSRKV